jgi:hypothetical protein
MAKVPKVKITISEKGGKVAAAMHSAASVGHSNKSVPTGRSRRIKVR